MWPSSWYSTGLSTEELFKIVKKKHSCLRIFVMWTFYHLVLNRVFLTAPPLLKTGPIWVPPSKNFGSILSPSGAVFMISPGRHTMWWMMQVNLIVHGNACECDPCGPWGGSLWIRGTYACHQGRHLRPYTQFSAPCITFTTIWQYGILLIRLH